MKNIIISPLLIITNEQVIELLKESIQIGLYIQKNATALRYPLSVIELQYDMWDKYNHFILKKVFDASDIIEEYDNAQPDIYIEDMYYEPSSADLIERIDDKIFYKLNKIELLIGSVSSKDS